MLKRGSYIFKPGWNGCKAYATFGIRLALCEMQMCLTVTGGSVEELQN